jgi:hypothetical protein
MRSSVLIGGVAVAAAVTLWFTHGPVEAAVLVAAVVALTGLYRLRRAARASLVYDRPPPRGSTPQDDVVRPAGQEVRHAVAGS